MNKTELINHIAEHNNCSKVEAERAINLFTSGITSAIKAGHDISLIGFGSFTVSDVAARAGINPKTKESLQIAAYKQVRFKVGSTLKDAANGKGGSNTDASTTKDTKNSSSKGSNTATDKNDSKNKDLNKDKDQNNKSGNNTKAANTKK